MKTIKIETTKETVSIAFDNGAWAEFCSPVRITIKNGRITHEWPEETAKVEDDAVLSAAAREQAEQLAKDPDAALAFLQRAGLVGDSPEPVAWRYKTKADGKWHVSDMNPTSVSEWNDIVEQEPLYAEPPLDKLRAACEWLLNCAEDLQERAHAAERELAALMQEGIKRK